MPYPEAESELLDGEGAKKKLERSESGIERLKEQVEKYERTKNAIMNLMGNENEEIMKFVFTEWKGVYMRETR